MRKIVISVIVVLTIAIFAVKAQALLIDPGDYGFGPDDGTELFNHCYCMAALEGYDIGGSWGTTFGFFYANDPGTLITIFDPLDEGTLKNPPKAKIDFVHGIVYDVDAGYLEQDIFTPQDNSIPIGFFLIPDGINTLYTVASMNNLWGDIAQTYRHTTVNDKYLIRFENPLSPDMTLAYEVVMGITPVQISEPATLTLLGMGVILIALYSVRSLILKRGSITN